MSSDATALAKGKQPAGKTKSWRGAVIVWSSVALVFLAAVMLFVLWIIGITHGREFDAGTWTFRSFTFIRNPLTGKQLTGITRSSDFPVPATITAHTSGGPLAPSVRWDLVELYKGPAYCSGQAHIMLDYLSALDLQNNYFWQTWTDENPQAAPILWAAVRDCVHLPRYDRLPEIFEAARSTTAPAKLKRKLRELMLDIARDEAELQASLGNEEGKSRAEKLMEAYQSTPIEPDEKLSDRKY